jgi:hypothetical protein
MSTLVNPAHPVPEDVAEALRRFGAERWAAVQRRNAIIDELGPTKSERKAIAESQLQLAEAMGVDVDAYRTRTRELREKRVKRVTELDLEVPEPRYDRPPVDRPPPPADHDFWWASTTPFLPDAGAMSSWGTVLPFKADFQADGLHISGKVTSHSGSLHSFSFGAVFLFGIDYERLPHSASNRWRSAPWAEAFGLVEGWTNVPHFPDGDFWSKTWMHRRQTLLQFGFGPTGSVPIIQGEGVDTTVLIDNGTTHHGYDYKELPGAMPMPRVSVGNLFPQTLWAQLEIRFDVQVEGDAGLWITPPNDVLLRIFQWPIGAYISLAHTHHT